MIEITESCNKVPPAPICGFDAAAAPDSFALPPDISVLAGPFEGCPLPAKVHSELLNFDTVVLLDPLRNIHGSATAL